jgi:hypothetical protein
MKTTMDLEEELDEFDGSFEREWNYENMINYVIFLCDIWAM